MNDRLKQLIIMGGVYLVFGLIALVLVFSGVNAASIKAGSEKVKTEAEVTEPAAEPEEPEVEEPAPEPEESAEPAEPEITEPAPEPEEPETTEPEVTEPEPEEPAEPAEPEVTEPEPEVTTPEPVVEDTPALGPEGKPLTVLAETAEDYKSFKTLNREKILHVRVAPDINSEIVARLSPGTEGLVLEVGDHWSRIRSFDGTITGYCSNEYLTFTDISKEEFQKLKKDSR